MKALCGYFIQRVFEKDNQEGLQCGWLCKPFNAYFEIQPNGNQHYQRDEYNKQHRPGFWLHGIIYLSILKQPGGVQAKQRATKL